MTSVERHLMRSEKAMGHSLAQVMEKGRHAPNQVGEVLALESLQAGRFASPDGMIARLTGQGLEIAEDVAAGQIGIRAIDAELVAAHRYHSPVNDVKFVPGVAWAIDSLILLEMFDLRELSDRL
jgi:hypothetical protein